MRTDTGQESHLRTHPQQLLRKVPALIDASVHGDKALGSGLVPHIVVVQAGVEHDDGKGKHVACICNHRQGGEAAAHWCPTGEGPRSASSLPPWQDGLPTLRDGSLQR